MKDPFYFSHDSVVLNNDCGDYEIIKSYTFKTLSEDECKSMKEIYDELIFLNSEVKKLRKENKELRANK